MFYNVENLFDIYDDTLTDDSDFLPGGVMGWNRTRYMKKLNSLYKTIAAAGQWLPPDIVAMCEVENRKVLEDLVNETYLSKFKYRIIHRDSPDRRGIDVCLIYRGDILKLLDFRYIIPSDTGNERFRTRSVLYSRFLAYGDTLHLFVNHWPSRRGGVLAGEPLRISISSMVRAIADSLGALNHHHDKIVITGDFNCRPDDYEIRSLVSGTGSGARLSNLSERITSSEYGTYRYKGVWEVIDQVIVSEALLKKGRGLFTGPDMVRIFSPEFLLVKDPDYPGQRPYSTYSGYRYQGGCSDHLPVLIDIGFR